MEPRATATGALFSPVLKDVEGQEYEESIDLVAEFAIHSAGHESVR